MPTSASVVPLEPRYRLAPPPPGRPAPAELPPPELPPLLPPPGLGARHLKQLDLDANTCAPQDGHVQSPGRAGGPPRPPRLLAAAALPLPLPPALLAVPLVLSSDLTSLPLMIFMPMAARAEDGASRRVAKCAALRADTQ